MEGAKRVHQADAELDQGDDDAKPDSVAVLMAVRNGASAVSEGLAIGRASDGRTDLSAANLRSGRVEATTPSPRSSFPPGCSSTRASPPAPFTVEELGGRPYVTCARQDARLKDDDPATGTTSGG